MKKWCRTFLLSCLLCLSLCTLAQATDGETLRVGLKYGSDAMSAANLQNYSAFGGYALGYFDADGSFEELLLSLLPVSVDLVQLVRQFLGPVRVLAEHQLQGGDGVIHAACRVDAGCNGVADVLGGDGLARKADFL